MRTHGRRCRVTVRRIDILDNNVGIGSRKSVVDEDEAAWDRVMEVNVKSMMLTMRYAIPAMIASGDGGSIINVLALFQH